MGLRRYPAPLPPGFNPNAQHPLAQDPAQAGGGGRGGLFDIIRGRGTPEQKAQLQRGLLAALAGMRGERGLAGALGAFGAGQIHAQDQQKLEQREQEERSRKTKFEEYVQKRIESTTDPNERERLMAILGTGRYIPPGQPRRPEAPHRTTRKLPGGREIVEEWDDASRAWKQVGDPYSAGGGSKVSLSQQREDVQQQSDWDWYRGIPREKRQTTEAQYPDRVKSGLRPFYGETAEQYRARMRQLDAQPAADPAAKAPPSPDAGGGASGVWGWLTGGDDTPVNPVLSELDRDYPAPSVGDPGRQAAPAAPSAQPAVKHPAPPDAQAPRPEATLESVNAKWRKTRDAFRQDPSLGVIGHGWGSAGIDRLSKAADERIERLERQSRAADPHSRQNAAAWKARAQAIRDAMEARDWVEVDRLMTLGLSGR